MQVIRDEFIEVPGGRIRFKTNFETPREGFPTILFNYGLVCSNQHWDHQLDYLDRKNYNLIIHDYRGHYDSKVEDMSSVTFKNIVSDINQILETLGVNKAHIIGHSMGVSVSLEFAKTYPKKVQSLTLLSGVVLSVQDVMFDSNIMSFITPYLSLLLDKYPDYYNWVWNNLSDTKITKTIVHQSGFNAKKVSKEFIDIYLTKIIELGPKLFFQLYNELTHHDIISHLDKIDHPALIIGGDKDNVIPNYLQFLLADLLKNSELYIVHKGSHVPQVDFPEFVNERFEKFISMN
jgi:non-heme chloroperoxidase